MAITYIGIGSNLENREENCLNAIKLLIVRGIKIKKQSALHETAPWGVEEQPGFINMAVEAETSLEPEQLLGVLKAVEQELGRQNTHRWGPRIIDLDILFYDEAVINTPTLQIPHPLMQQRDFVLKPMAEIASEVVHPVIKRTIAMLLSELNNSAIKDR